MAGQTSARRPSEAPRRRRQRALVLPPVLLLPLVAVVLLLLAPPPSARAHAPGEQVDGDKATTAKGALSAEAVDALVSRFADLVLRAAAGGGGTGDGGGEGGGGGGGGDGEGSAQGAAAASGAGSAAGAASSSSFSFSPSPLDPGAESLLARLLDEVLPRSKNGDGDGESGDDADRRDALRKQTVGAMGLALPPPPPPSSPDAPSSQRRRLQQNATPVSPIVPPTTGMFTVNNGGRFGGYSQAFQILFSNAFDFFLRGGLAFLVPIIGDTLAPLRRYNWVRDVGNAVDAPFDNVINANYVPLPQTTDDLVALALRVLAPVCAEEKATGGNKVLGAVRGAAAEVELVPWECEVVPNDDDDDDDDDDDENEGDENGKEGNDGGGGGGGDKLPPKDEQTKAEAWLRAKLKKAGGRQRIDWASCIPSKLVVRLKPAIVNGPYYSAASYTAAECAFSQPFGLGTTVRLGLDSAAVDFKLSRIGVDVVPTVVQFEVAGRFFPWLAEEPANSGGNPDPRTVAFTSASNRTTGSR